MIGRDRVHAATGRRMTLAAASGLLAAVAFGGPAFAQDASASPAAMSPGTSPAAMDMPSGEGIRVGVSIWGHVPWLDSYGDFLKQYGEAAGATMDILYSDMTAATQSSQVDTLLAKDPDIILYTGLDPEADNGIIARIKAAGVPVVAGILEPTAEGMGLVDAYRGPNDLDHGRIGADQLAAALEGKTGDLAIVRGAAGGTDNLNRAKAFTEEMAKLRPDLQIVADQDTDWADEKIPYDTTAAMLAQHPNIIGIFTEADTIANAAAKAVADAGLTGKVAIQGLGGSCEGFDLVRNGQIVSTTLQDPEIGAVDVLKAGLEIAHGDAVDKIGYMDLPVLTAANVDQYTCHW